MINVLNNYTTSLQQLLKKYFIVIMHIWVKYMMKNIKWYLFMVCVLSKHVQN